MSAVDRSSPVWESKTADSAAALAQNVSAAVERRAAVHAALGEPVRLAIVEELARSDRTPSYLATHFGLATNLLAHHLDVLERVGLIERRVSSGDRRRRYLRLRHPTPPAPPLAAAATRPAARPDRRRVAADPNGLPAEPDNGPTVAPGTHPGGHGARRALFVCTHNSARSQIAAALWRVRTGGAASSAGTHPADWVHPGAVAAAQRAGLDLGGERPRLLDDGDADAELVVTVCDRAHEEIRPPDSWLHWSVPDPVETGTPDAFDAALVELDERITSLASDIAPHQA